MNQIILTGRPTEDPKVTYTTGSEPVAHAVFNFAAPDMSMRKDEQGNYPTDFLGVHAGEGWQRLLKNIVIKAQNFSLLED